MKAEHIKVILQRRFQCTESPEKTCCPHSTAYPKSSAEEPQVAFQSPQPLDNTFQFAHECMICKSSEQFERSLDQALNFRI